MGKQAILFNSHHTPSLSFDPESIQGTVVVGYKTSFSRVIGWHHVQFQISRCGCQVPVQLGWKKHPVVEI
jgi:hypothetical protein